MTSKPVAFLLADLGITQSHSRPHVSNDNPFSEAQFKTLKYRRLRGSLDRGGARALHLGNDHIATVATAANTEANRATGRARGVGEVRSSRCPSLVRPELHPP